MNIGHFTDGSLVSVREMLSGTLDYTRCVRPNGTAYGTGGECRKGVEKEKEKAPSVEDIKLVLNKEQKEEAKKEFRQVHDRFESWIPDKEDKAYKNNVEALKPYRNLSNDEKAALGLYTREEDAYYEQVNERLRTGSITGDKERDAMVDYVSKNLESAINKLPAEKGNFMKIVHGDFATKLSSLSPGDVVQDKGFGSYTEKGQNDVLDHFVTYGESNAVIRVKGTTFRYVSYASAYAGNEEEYLSPPGTKLKFIRKLRNRHEDMYGDKHPIYEFEEVK